MTPEELTAQRRSSHGDFTNVSQTAQALKNVARESVNWKDGKLTDVQKESVDMILHKVARVLCGNPNHKDHWDDIGGYAHITAIRVET